MLGWHNAGLWREWNVLFCLDSFFPFHLDSFFLTGRPCFLLCSSVLCQHQPWASHRENALMCPHCAAAPLCPDWWIAGGAGGAMWEWMGDESERGSKGAPAHRALPVCLLHLQLPPLTAGWTPVSATITRSLWPPSLPLSSFLSLSLSQFISSLSLHVLLFSFLPFVYLSVNVLWESNRWQVNLSVCGVLGRTELNETPALFRQIYRNSKGGRKRKVCLQYTGVVLIIIQTEKFLYIQPSKDFNFPVNNTWLHLLTPRLLFLFSVQWEFD